MRALCTVSGPLAAPASAASGAQLASGARFLALRVPGQSAPLHFVVEAKSRIRELRAQACDHFRAQGMLDVDLFGLATFADGEYLFADMESKLSKYAPKSWRSSHTHGLDANGRPLLELHLAVQFYVDSPLLLHDELSRQHYFMQLRANLVCRDVTSPDVILLLAGLALQADYGDAAQYDEASQRDYFNVKDYAPPSLSLSGDWVATAMRACHREHRGLSRPDAQTHFIREACMLPDPINAHRYRLRTSKVETDVGSVWLSICARGIKIDPDDGPSCSYVWSSIGKLSFDRKKFEIRTDNGKITLYASNDDKSKFLLSLCRETHQFSMKIASQLSEVLIREEEERKCCYGYSRTLNLPHSKGKSDQRISVISSTSSNTTSGIVSDRVHSEDELEIMIDSPPAPSTESLAFAHLLDYSKNNFLRQFSQERLHKTTSLQYPRSRILNFLELKNNDASTVSKAVGESSQSTSSVTNLHSDGAGSSSENRKEEESESPISTKLKCTGSQCSSSCSTVVMGRAGLRAMRPASNASSLEMSYCHTAQNSSISDNNTISTQHTESATALYTVATIAASSETSGVYTMASSEITGHPSEIAETDVDVTCSRTDSSSLHYSTFCPKDANGLNKFSSVSLLANSVCDSSSHRMKESNIQFRVDSNGDFTSVDCIDGVSTYACTDEDDKSSVFRQRANSNVSVDSFHGDGSDPTDNKHNLLSALELSDLIVGRGVYPKRQSVSDTLDSVSDYVMLPLSLSGESYIQGHEDTAPSEEDYPNIDNTFLHRPPTPPKRIDSWREHSLSLTDIVDLECLPVVPPLLEIAMKPPPPYEFNHNTLPPTPPQMQTDLNEINLTIGIPIRDPPPYPGSSHSKKPSDREEASARFITTKPMINILTAEIGDVPKCKEKTFASPVVLEHRMKKLSLSGSSQICTLGPEPDRQSNTSLPSQMGLPSTSSLDSPVCESKVTAREPSLLVPMMKPTRLLPPPPSLPRQPPPPPPPPTRTFYSHHQHLARTQIHQFQQQLYSDVDYVIYPLQDPAISQQNYLDSKIATHSRNVSACHKNSALYRSTPFLSSNTAYSSTQNLSDSYIQLHSTSSSIYGPPGHSSSLRRDLPVAPYRAKMPLPSPLPLSLARTKSDDNLLKVATGTPHRRIPPPPPPPPYRRNTPIPHPPAPAPIYLAKENTHTEQNIHQAIKSKNCDTGGSIDIKTLREKSKNLDLPLIAALCNDRSLLKQTKAFVMPKHLSTCQNVDATSEKNTSSAMQCDKSFDTMQHLSKEKHIKSSQNPTRTVKKMANHRHPNDKLPAIPTTEVHTPRALSNTYVAHPGAGGLKNKKMQSRS